MRTILELFAKSPFEPLTRHARKVYDVTGQVRPLMEAFLAENWERTREVYEEISHLEHQADEIKQEIRDHLPRSLFMPVDRGDILTFLREQDRIADAVEDVAVLLMMRRTTAPEEFKPRVRALVEQVLNTTETWYRVAMDLPGLQRASFTGPEVERVLELIRRVSDQEHEADTRQHAAGRGIIQYEVEVGAVSILFWMRIFETLGRIANRAESTADMVRLMLARA
ncbi:MAG: TIGR00153 family protein [Gemmatimonadetes bacterium]|nr:TIGR00153 family protein [Gemmatimonadota bacterium]